MLHKFNIAKFCYNLFIYFYFSVVTEMIIFLYLGLILFDVSVHNWDTGLICWTILFATIFRPIGKLLQLTNCLCVCVCERERVLRIYFAGTIVLTLLVNLFRFHKINMKQVFIMVCKYITFLYFIP